MMDSLMPEEGAISPSAIGFSTSMLGISTESSRMLKLVVCDAAPLTIRGSAVCFLVKAVEEGSKVERIQKIAARHARDAKEVFKVSTPWRIVTQSRLP